MDASLTAQTGSVKSEPASMTLQKQQFYRHDYLLVVFRDVLRLSDYLIVTLAVIVSGIVLFGLAPLAGKAAILYGFQGRQLINTIFAVLQVLLIYPVLAWVSVSLPAELANLFNTLHDNGVIGEPRSAGSGGLTYEAFLQKFVAWADSIWWFVGAIVVVAAYWIYRLTIVWPFFSKQGGLWLQIAILAISSFMIYAVFYSVVRILVTLVFANWLIRAFTVKVNPLHPDGSAGLGALGYMLILSVVLLVTMGVAALVMNSSYLLGNDTSFSVVEAVFFGAIYLALAPSLLIGWLALPHQAMVDARNDVLLPLSREFQLAVVQTDPAGKADASSIKADNDRLDELKRRYKLVEDTYPTYPLAIEKVRRLAATLTLPALLPILSPFILALATYVSKTFLH